MNAPDILLVVLLSVAVVVCVFAIWALREMVATARSVRLLSDDTRERLVPLLDKVDVTVDAANVELLRVDAIITQVETASARVSHASDTLSNVVSAPGEIVNDVATRVRRAWKDRRRTDESARSERGSAPDDSGEEGQDLSASGTIGSEVDETPEHHATDSTLASAPAASEER